MMRFGSRIPSFLAQPPLFFHFCRSKEGDRSKETTKENKRKKVTF